MTSTPEADNNKLGAAAGLGLCAIVIAMAVLAFWIWSNAGPARAALEEQRRKEIAEESRLVCEKWGLPFGTQKHIECAADLKLVREQHEKRLLMDADLR